MFGSTYCSRVPVNQEDHGLSLPAAAERLSIKRTGVRVYLLQYRACQSKGPGFEFTYCSRGPVNQEGQDSSLPTAVERLSIKRTRVQVYLLQ